MMMSSRTTSMLALVLGTSIGWSSFAFAAEAPAPAAAGMHKRREPPPAVIPAQEVQAAQKMYE